MENIEHVYHLAALVCTLSTLLCLIGTWKLTRPPGRDAGPRRRPPVTVLKPLCGVDDALASNLEAFFRLRYDHYELLFGVEGYDDPAIPVVRALRARYPHVRSRLVIHEGQRGLNPKVSNLKAMLETGTHDIVVISDSNIAVGEDYLTSMVDVLESDDAVGLVSNLIVGEGERTLGAMLENVQVNGFISGTVAAAQLIPGQAIALGKSMMFRRSVFDRLGGLDSVASVLAEDYVMGRMFQVAGYDVKLCGAPIRNVNVSNSLERFFLRHHRWALMRSRLNPIVYALEPLSSPTAVTLLALLLQPAESWPLVWGLALTVIRDGGQWSLLRGWDGLGRALLLGVVKDLVMLGVWAVSPFASRVGWRGRRFRIAMGTRIYAESPLELPEPAVGSRRRG